MCWPPAAQLLANMRAALRQRRFAAIVVDGPDFVRAFPELEQAYTVAGAAADGAAFYNVAGARTLPEILYLPKLLPDTTRGRCTRRYWRQCGSNLFEIGERS